MIDAQNMAQRIVEAGSGGRAPLALLEVVFAREGDAAIASALAFWVLSVVGGEALDVDVEAVTAALLRLLELPS